MRAAVHQIRATMILLRPARVSLLGTSLLELSVEFQFIDCLSRTNRADSGGETRRLVAALPPPIQWFKRPEANNGTVVD